MAKLKRRIFFWGLVLVFLAIAPTIVLYSRGYRFDSHRGVFVHSGTITIKSNPQNIDVALNDQVSQSKSLNRINNSYNIPGLLPDNYNIKISAPDFQVWSKKTDVHSGLASEFWNVVLVRNSYQRTSFPDTSDIGSFYMSPKNKYIAYTATQDQNLNIKIFNINNKKTEENFPFSGWNFINEDRKENIEWSPEEDYLSVPVQKEIQSPTNAKKSKDSASAVNSSSTLYNYFIVDVKNPDNSPTNLNEFLGRSDIRRVRWDPKDKKYLFFLEGNSFYRANIEDKSDVTLISDNVSSFDLTKNNAYYVKSPNNLVYRSSLDGHSNQDQMTNGYPGSPDDIVDRIIMYDESRIALISQNKGLFVYNEGEHDTYFRKLGSDVESIHFSDDGKKMVFWTNNEIFVYFLRDWKVEPIRSENDLTSITRYSEPIKNVEWFKDYEHVIFSTGRWTKIIELDPRDHRNCDDLINTTLETPFVRYNSYWEFLYFTDKTSDSTTLNYIVFPEPTPLLGIGGN